MALAPIVCSTPPFSRDKMRGQQEMQTYLLQALATDDNTIATSVAGTNSRLDAANTNLATVNANLVSFQAANHTDITALSANTTNNHADLVQLHTDLVASNSNTLATTTALGAGGTLHADNVSMNTKLDTLNTTLVSGQTHIDLVALKASVDALLAAQPVSTGLSVYSAALSLLGTATIKNAAGKVYTIISSGAISLQDGAGTTYYFPSGCNIVLWQPISFGTSIKIAAIAASNITIQYS